MERSFPFILLTTIAVFFITGGVLYKMGKDGLLLDSRQMDVIQTSFVMEEEKPKPKAEPPKPRPVEKKKVEENIPVDLTRKPEPEEDKPVVKKEVRQVYGLKKVYSQGLGAGGDADDAIVGKIGNTLNKDYDTLTATSDDLKRKPQPTPVSLPVTKAPAPASVTKKPALKASFRSAKPQYSKDMLQNRVEGVVKARILIDADGSVKKVEILSDIGYDSAEIAEQFLLTLQFEPAMMGEQAISVWIPFSIRFELI